MPSLLFRLPGRADKLGAWLVSLLPEVDRSTRRRWVEEGRVSVEGRVLHRANVDCPAGARVEIEDVPEEILATLPAGVHAQWVGLIDAPPWRAGRLQVDEKRELEFIIEASRDGLARIRLVGSECDAAALCRALARAEMPLVGDLERGGLAVVGGVRLVAKGTPSSSADPVWPDEPPWPTADPDIEGEAPAPALHVSDETARAIRRGHPWILPDEASDPAARFRPGSLVRVVSRSDEALGLALVEGEARLAARVWVGGEASASRVPSIEARVARALARRRTLLVDARISGTNAFRLIHAEADALPGLVVDRLGPLLRVLVTGRASELIRERVVAALQAQLPLTPEGQVWSVLELLHLRGPGPSRFERVRWVAGGPEQLVESGARVDDGGFAVLERGLQFRIDPGWDTPQTVRPGIGLFVDQRENRARLDPHAARGGEWLNLFAHTGAFSVSLLASGAAHVTSVDLSAAYLKRLEENLAANGARGVEPTRNTSVRIDGRRFLETLPPARRFAGIVLDPPTSAAAGRRFWSLARDLEPTLRRCVERLEAGGVLLVTQNRSGPPLGLDRILERIASRARRGIARLEPAPAGADHPRLRGFPEGEPFEGWLLQLD